MPVQTIKVEIQDVNTAFMKFSEAIAKFSEWLDAEREKTDCQAYGIWNPLMITFVGVEYHKNHNSYVEASAVFNIEHTEKTV